MFFDSWMGLVRVLVVGVLAYAAVVVLLRVTGKRTLSKMNAFDLIVTVALGSTLATVILSEGVALAEGLVALALLVFLQLAVAWLSARSTRIRDIVKGEPTLLLYRGEMITGALVDQRVAPEEVMAAVRANGYRSLDRVGAVVLETDGSFSVIGASAEGPPSALATVARLPEDET